MSVCRKRWKTSCPVAWAQPSDRSRRPSPRPPRISPPGPGRCPMSGPRSRSRTAGLGTRVSIRSSSPSRRPRKRRRSTDARPSFAACSTAGSAPSSSYCPGASISSPPDVGAPCVDGRRRSSSFCKARTTEVRDSRNAIAALLQQESAGSEPVRAALGRLDEELRTTREQIQAAAESMAEEG